MQIFLILYVTTIALCWARPQSYSSSPSSLILKFDNYRLTDGSYRYNVETSDGFEKEEIGKIEKPGGGDESLTVTGHYSYIGDDGKTYSVKYRANENGFQPEGEHLVQIPAVEKEAPIFVGISTALLASLTGT